MGSDTNSLNGIEIGHGAVASYRYNFCIPLISVIGVNSDKLIPIGSLNNLQLQMTTANLNPLVSYCTAITTQPVFTNVLLSEFQLSCTYTNSAVTLPTGSSGAQQLLLQIRNSSVKSVLHQFGMSAGVTANALLCPNSYYDAINPSLTSRQLQAGGNFFPNRPINDCQRPAEGYMYMIQAIGGNIPKALGTAVNRNTYNACIPSVPAGSDSTLVVPANGLRPTPSGDDNAFGQISKYPNMAYYGYDLEKSSGVLFQGINTRASPPFLNMTLAQATAQTLIMQAWGLSDVVLVIDTVAKQIQAFI